METMKTEHDIRIEQVAEWFAVEQDIRYTAEEFADKITAKITELTSDRDEQSAIADELLQWAEDEAFGEKDRNAAALRIAYNRLTLLGPRV